MPKPRFDYDARRSGGLRVNVDHLRFLPRTKCTVQACCIWPLLKWGHCGRDLITRPRSSQRNMKATTPPRGIWCSRRVIDTAVRTTQHLQWIHMALFSSINAGSHARWKKPIAKPEAVSAPMLKEEEKKMQPISEYDGSDLTAQDGAERFRSPILSFVYFQRFVVSRKGRECARRSFREHCSSRHHELPARAAAHADNIVTAQATLQFNTTGKTKHRFTRHHAHRRVSCHVE